MLPRLIRFSFAILFACFLAACAAQGPPQPPRVERPEQVKDLRIEQTGRSFKINFTLPKLATDGEQLAKPLEVEIFREVTPVGQTPPGMPAAARPWVALSSQEVAHDSHGPTFVYQFSLSDQDFNADLGATLAFYVVTLTRGFRHRPIRSNPSKIAETTLMDVTAPVEHLAVKTTEKALVLHWSPLQQTLSGRPAAHLTGYRIYTSPTGEAGSFHLFSEAQSPELSIRDFQFGQHYYFRVRAVFTKDGHTAESADSSIVEVTPRDTFPPSPPQGLSALYAAGAVELVWEANTEPDLASYSVYRREDDKPFEPVSKILLRTSVYRDTTVQPGHRYFYAVTALDFSGNESLKSRPVSVETR